MDEEPMPQPQDRAETAAPAPGGAALQEAVAAYADALVTAFAPCRAEGVLQRDLAAALHIDPGTLSRYFTGQRILPCDLLPAFTSHLAELGHPLTGHDIRDLELLERNVRRYRSPDGRRIAELEDERDALRTDLAAVQETLRRALADGHARDEELAGQLTEVRDDASRLRRALAEQDLVITTLRSRLTEAEEARRDAEEQAAAEAARADELVGRISDAHTQLAAAARLIGDADRDAARAEERATALGAEIKVLRRQVRALLKEPFPDPDTSIPPSSTHDGASGHSPAELVSAQLRPSVAEGTTAHTTATGTTSPASVPAPRPAPAFHGIAPHSVRTRSLRPNLNLSWRWWAKAVAWVFSLLLVAAAVAAFTAAHIPHFAYTRAALCTADQISQADISDCLTRQTGTVTNRAKKRNAESTSYTVTVATGSGKKTWDVGRSFYNGTQPGTRVAINAYKGTIVTVTNGTLTADVAGVTAFLSWKQVAAPLALMTAAAIPLIAVGDRFFRSIKLFGLLPMAAIWNGFLAAVTFGNAGLESWTSTTTAVVHALAWALTCLPSLVMAALD
ncbi:hypothetical protein [Streptomyces lavendofoliae]|uniref:hypothetical protein n=1 Tax=Streptomyces lavendofoliae TaxID=67314 RepID=UPI003D90A2B6